MLPRNQRGLSGSAVAHMVSDLVVVDPANLLPRSLFPDRKEAFVDPTTDPLFWALKMFKHGIH